MSRVRAIRGGGVSFLFSKSYQRLKSSLFWSWVFGLSGEAVKQWGKIARAGAQ